MSVIHASSASYSPPEFNVIKYVQSEIPLVLVTRKEDFTFNEELKRLDKWIMIDMCEYNWDWDLKKSGSHFFGLNTDEFPHFKGDEWKKFDDWVYDNEPILYLKRELLAEQASEWAKSITYPAYFGPFAVQDEQSFNMRPIELNHYFGRSSEHRMIFQGNAYIHASKHGIEICDNLYHLNGYLNERPKRLWSSVHIPHFARISLQHILDVNHLSKLSLSMPGGGNNCFRDSEACLNSIMVLKNSGIAFPFEWINGENCIMYNGDDPIPAIEEALKRNDLYQIYRKGVENSWNYHIDTYTDFLENTIKSAS